MLSFGDPRRFRLRNGDHGIAATPEIARELERRDREEFEANAQQRVVDLLEALRTARTMALPGYDEDSLSVRNRLNDTFLYLTSAVERLS